MFRGFSSERPAVSGTRINVVYDGSGPPLLLLHAGPQTHAMWHRVAPRLAERFTIVAPICAATETATRRPRMPATSRTSKRATADDQVAAMTMAVAFVR